MTERMDISKWYGHSIRIPRIGDWQFTWFLTAALGLVRSVVKERLVDRLSVRFDKATRTAAADYENKTIYINEAYLHGKLMDDGITHNSTTTLGVIMGILVHEAGHFAYSPLTLKPFVDYIKANTTCIFHEDLAAQMGNLVEDIYIETKIGKDVSSLYWMLEATNDVFFSEERRAEFIQNALPYEDAPEDACGIGAVGSLCLLAKVLKVEPELNPYLSKIYNIALSAGEADAFEFDRLGIALALYNEIMRNCKVPPSSKPLESFAENIEGLNAKMGKGERPIFINLSGTDTGQAGKINSMLKTHENSIFVAGEDMSDAPGLQTVQLYIEIPIKASDVSIQMDKRYLALAEVARQRSAVNRPYGLDLNRGSRIRKLYRIATDQKIFAQPQPFGTYQPMQVAILMDCSGSMDSPLEGGEENGKTRLEAAAEAVYGAAHGLMEGRCEVAVYGHTADKEGDVTCSIYKLKSLGEGLEALPYRLKEVVNGRYHWNNRDGDAISYVAKKLVDRRKRRIVVIISDGRPAGEGYSGRVGVEHSRGVVAGLKEQGIEVFCISITESARPHNDRIYGAKHNVFNADPNVIEGLVAALVGG